MGAVGLPPHTSHMTQPLDSSCFGALKRAWVMSATGSLWRILAELLRDLSFQGYHKAWDHAMTMSNVTAGFRATGVIQPQRIVLLRVSHIAASLAEKTGLSYMYIPLYSPSRTCHEESHSICTFTAEEMEHFQHRFEEGFDLDTDERYNDWVRMYHPVSQASKLSHTPKYRSTTLAKVLIPDLPIRKPSIRTKTSARY